MARRRSSSDRRTTRDSKCVPPPAAVVNVAKAIARMLARDDHERERKDDQRS